MRMWMRGDTMKLGEIRFYSSGVMLHNRLTKPVREQLTVNTMSGILQTTNLPSVVPWAWDMDL